MVKTKLLKVSYKDAKNAIMLTTYADTLVIDEENPRKNILIAIRFGGDPEPVRAMADAIFGGGDIEMETQNGLVRLTALTKQYKRQIGRGSVYAEATLTVLDDADVTAKNGDSGTDESDARAQTNIQMPPRTCYFFCPPDDDGRLFEEIDRKIGAPLIPEFRDYFLNALRKEGMRIRLPALW